MLHSFRLLAQMTAVTKHQKNTNIHPRKLNRGKAQGTTMGAGKQKKQAGLATSLLKKKNLKLFSYYATRSLRKERKAPMPNGSNIKAPAAMVVGSGTGA